MRVSWLIAFLIAAAAIAWIGSSYVFPAQEETSAAESDPAATETPAAAAHQPAVRVMTISAQPMTNALELQGRTIANRQTEVRSEVDALVAEIMAERGELIEEGQMIARMAVEDRQARVREAEALVAQRRIEFEAAERLNNQGYRSDTDVAQARAQLDSAEALLELARINLERINIRAPFGGVVAERPIEVGNYVRVGDTVATILDLDPITVAGQVAERFLGQIEYGTVAQVTFINGQTVPGVVSFIASTTDPATRTYRVEVEVPNPDNRIIEGLTARLDLPIRQVEAHLLSPAVLNLSDGGEVGVYAVNEDNVVEFHPGSIVGSNGELVWLGGLPETLRIIVVGQGFVTPGTEVEVEEVDEIPNRPDALTAVGDNA
ncbi:MAG: efflux RND transporter periplasmic adaptor subunit [Azospirillaceae bacterium]